MNARRRPALASLIVAVAAAAWLAAGCDSATNENGPDATVGDTAGPGGDAATEGDTPPGDPDTTLTQDSAQNPDAAPAESQYIASGAERILNPSIPEADMQALIAGNSAFACELFQQLRGNGQNLFFSPHSISTALAMTYAGAKGDTAAQMAATLHFTLPQAQLHPALNALDQILESRNHPTEPDTRPFLLRVTNALWGQRDYPFRNDFLDLLALNYGAGLRVLDFATQPEPSRILINDWVEEQTEGRIVDLIPQGLIDSLTRLVLTNAIYFSAAWEYPFDAADTAPGPFTLGDGSPVTVDAMHLSEGMFWAQGDGFAALQVPYDGQALDMLILLPDAGAAETFESRVSAGLLADLDALWEYRIVDFTLPKFSTESSFLMRDMLQAMGMVVPFEGGAADFSGMADTNELFIGQVVHKAFVAVDESGTEAAAATAVIMEGSGMPEYATFTVDRPFVFLIRDRATGAILFIGRIVDPR